MLGSQKKHGKTLLTFQEKQIGVCKLSNLVVECLKCGAYMQPFLKSTKYMKIECYLECPKCGEIVKVKVI